MEHEDNPFAIVLRDPQSLAEQEKLAVIEKKIEKNDRTIWNYLVHLQAIGLTGVTYGLAVGMIGCATANPLLGSAAALIGLRSFAVTKRSSLVKKELYRENKSFSDARDEILKARYQNSKAMIEAVLQKALEETGLPQGLELPMVEPTGEQKSVRIESVAPILIEQDGEVEEKATDIVVAIDDHKMDAKIEIRDGSDRKLGAILFRDEAGHRRIKILDSRINGSWRFGFSDEKIAAEIDATLKDAFATKAPVPHQEIGMTNKAGKKGVIRIEAVEPIRVFKHGHLHCKANIVTARLYEALEETVAGIAVKGNPVKHIFRSTIPMRMENAGPR